MKGLLLGLFCLSTLAAGTAQAEMSHRVTELKTHTGLIFKNLSLRESANVLKSLKEGETIELRESHIYPEEVSEVILGKLTNIRITEKRPNQKDYN